MNKQKELNEFLNKKRYILIDKKTGKPYSISSKGFSNCLQLRYKGNYYINVMVFEKTFPLKCLYFNKDTREIERLNYNPLKDERGKKRFQKAKNEIVWKKLPRDKKIEINKKVRFNFEEVTLIDLYE